MATTTKLKSSTAKKKTTTDGSQEFSLVAPEAREIYIAGDFNGWQQDAAAYRMTKYKGAWRKKLKLPPGRYEYQFVVDGRWCPDPVNPQRQANPYGSENSVMEVS